MLMGTLSEAVSCRKGTFAQVRAYKHSTAACCLKYNLSPFQHCMMFVDTTAKLSCPKNVVLCVFKCIDLCSTMFRRQRKKSNRQQKLSNPTTSHVNMSSELHLYLLRADRQTHGQTDRHTDRLTYRHTHTHTHYSTPYLFVLKPLTLPSCTSPASFSGSSDEQPRSLGLN